MPRRRVTSRVQSRSDGEPLARRRDMRLPGPLDLDVEQRAADKYGGNYSAALRELVAGGVRLWDGDAADLCLRPELAGLSGAVCDRRRGHPLPHTFAPEWRLRPRREPAEPNRMPPYDPAEWPGPAL